MSTTRFAQEPQDVLSLLLRCGARDEIFEVICGFLFDSDLVALQQVNAEMDKVVEYIRQRRTHFLRRWNRNDVKEMKLTLETRLKRVTRAYIFAIDRQLAYIQVNYCDSDCSVLAFDYHCGVMRGEFQRCLERSNQPIQWDLASNDNVLVIADLADPDPVISVFCKKTLENLRTIQIYELDKKKVRSLWCLDTQPNTLIVVWQHSDELEPLTGITEVSLDTFKMIGEWKVDARVNFGKELGGVLYGLDFSDAGSYAWNSKTKALDPVIIPGPFRPAYTSVCDCYTYLHFAKAGELTGISKLVEEEDWFDHAGYLLYKSFDTNWLWHCRQFSKDCKTSVMRCNTTGGPFIANGRCLLVHDSDSNRVNMVDLKNEHQTDNLDFDSDSDSYEVAFFADGTGHIAVDIENEKFLVVTTTKIRKK